MKKGIRGVKPRVPFVSVRSHPVISGSCLRILFFLFCIMALYPFEGIFFAGLVVVPCEGRAFVAEGQGTGTVFVLGLLVRLFAVLAEGDLCLGAA